ncbi:MAG: type III-B CRISPR module-associated protein Cmr5 [Chloroflexaceae bacterium]|nr:type III-B CRISPR module-associated protein Cmr5 [Chloroflexaceae bacterium]
MHTRDQQYAATIFEQVQSIATNPEQKQEYGSIAHKLPVLIRTAGLAQALAFVEARGKPPHQLLLNHLATTINCQNLVEQSRTVELNEYMRLTQQALDALLWYKRFAQSVLGVEAGEENSEGDN